AGGVIRARAHTAGGYQNGSAGLVTAQVGSRSFGGVAVGDSAALTFTIRNTGNAALTGLGITKEGTDEAMFAVTAGPAAPVPGAGGSTTFTVRFTPTGTGPKSAIFHIASNDS